MKKHGKLNVAEMLTLPLRAYDVHRFSGECIHHRESVAEHMWLNAFFSLCIAREIEAQGWRDVIDYGKLMQRAVLHDVEELFTGDLTRDIKYGGDGSIKEYFDKLGGEVVEIMQKRLGVQFAIYWCEAKTHDLEGVIVALADFLCVTAFCLRESRSGNRTIRTVLEGNRSWLVEFSEQLGEFVEDTGVTEFPFRDIIAEACGLITDQLKGTKYASHV